MKMKKKIFFLHSYPYPYPSFLTDRAMTFDFEKFPVYIQAENMYSLLVRDIFCINFNKDLKDQLKRASTSIILNIAE